MTSLLSDLYRYRQRDGKHALEDFLTESLAAIMRALPRELFCEFILRLTGQDASGHLTENVKLQIATQFVIERENGGTQRPDIVVLLNDEPWLLFENKVAAHVDMSEREDGEIESQLHRYAKWLRGKRVKQDGLSKAIVFITHGTPAPDDFRAVPPDPVYGDLGRHVSKWGAVGRTLDAITEKLLTEIHARALVEGFQQFLEDHRMTSEYPSSSDVALLGLMMPSITKLKTLVDEMLTKAEKLGPTNGRAVRATFEPKDGCYEGTRWHHIEGWPTGVLICTGLWFPDLSDQWDESAFGDDAPLITSDPKVFVYVGREEDDGLISVTGQPDGPWHRPNDEFLAFEDFGRFLGGPDQAQMEIIDWVEQRVTEMQAFIASQ